MNKKHILLIEPGYKNKYPPLGLMKLSAYHKECGDHVRFVKGEDSSVLSHAWDRVYVTTLFSFEWNRISQAIDFAIEAASNQSERVFVGGIAASLMHSEFIKVPKWVGVRFIKGLLDEAPPVSLKLSVKDGDFGLEDFTASPIEYRIPDYQILDQTDYRYPVHDAYFGYASRGCIRKCHFCGVPKLEGGQKEMPPLFDLVNGISRAHGEKKDLILMDNNVTASARYREVIAEIVDLGFGVGAKFEKNGRFVKRRVDFNQGVDARILSKSSMYLKELSKVCIDPLRIAFDHLGVRKVYETAIRMAADNNIRSLSNYMLYNFMDSPNDLYQRMKLNIELNEQLGLRIWSFPMRYQPVTLKDRSHVGKNWNSYYLRSFQIMLQATRGIVSGSRDFFYVAYGESAESFQHLLSLPHGFIFHREHYKSGNGKAVRDEYISLRNQLSSSQEQEFLTYLAKPVGGKRLRDQYFESIVADRQADYKIREVMKFHFLDTKSCSAVTDTNVLPELHHLNPDYVMPNDDEIVEDAGLYELEMNDKEDFSKINVLPVSFKDTRILGH